MPFVPDTFSDLTPFLTHPQFAILTFLGDGRRRQFDLEGVALRVNAAEEVGDVVVSRLFVEPAEVAIGCPRRKREGCRGAGPAKVNDIGGGA